MPRCTSAMPMRCGFRTKLLRRFQALRRPRIRRLRTALMSIRMTNATDIIRIISQLLLSGVLCFTGGCQQTPVKPRPHPQQDPATLKVAKIDWTMTRVDRGKALRIEYRVTNVSDKRIFLSDIIHEYHS